MFSEGMVCPVCENGTMKSILKDLDFEYKGKGARIPNSKVLQCEECEEYFLNEKDEREIERMLTNFRRSIDGLLTSDEIKEIRQSFGMTQVRFAQALRVGEKNFARYESGQSTQGRQADNVLRILREFPQALRAIYQDYDGWERVDRISAKLITQKRKNINVTVRNSSECQTSDEGLNHARAL